MTCHVYITGAQGSGKSELAKALSLHHSMRMVDIDASEWVATDPPYRLRRPTAATLAEIAAFLDGPRSCVVAGSLFPWGLSVLPRFALAILIVTPRRVRLERLRRRQALNFGVSVLPGGDMYEAHKEFLRRAAEYDKNLPTARSLERDLRWLRTLPGKSLLLDGTSPIDALWTKVIRTMRSEAKALDASH